MKQRLAMTTLVVRDYDEAIAFYTEKLRFRLLEDTHMSETKRWVVIAPPGAHDTALLLAKAVGEAQQNCIGNQTGGRVFLFLYTDDFDRDYQRMLEHGVEFVRPPTQEPYGKVAVLADLYGNLIDFIQPDA